MTRTSRRSSSRLWQFVVGYAAVVGLIVWGCGVPGGGGTPTPSPSGNPTPTPSTSPTPTPSGSPTPTPTNSPTPTPTASPSPTPSSRPCPQVSCANDGDCSDGLFCNGSETCNTLTQSCVCTDAPCDPDTEECDEAEDDCVPIADPGCTRDQDCDSDEYCNENTGQCLPDFTATCVPGAGPCNIGNSSPGCNNPDCCEAVCTFDPTCCLIQWTQQCADLAFSTSACLANP